MSNALVIKTTGLSYHYSKGVKTLDSINLQVERGSIYGFLGPNGSGKTTTLSLLLGLLNNQEGSIEIFGQNLYTDRVSILKKIGSLIEAPSLYGHLTAQENLEVYRSVYGVSKERVVEVLGIVGLSDTGKKPAKKFSLGMKQRLSIALALLPNPELLILDEPSNGLDPAGIIELRQLISKLNEEYGMTILISSHLLSEVEKMVTHVGIVYKGTMRFQGSLSGLQKLQRRSAKVFIKTSDNVQAADLLKNYSPEMDGHTFTIDCGSSQQVAEINRLLIQHGLDVYLLHPRENDLEQLFINLTSDHS
ncbi:MAG: transporter ATPase [Flaviaesturariibacter sp.]|nr:transporter ATPase [Flaviaesturariibacter sp.]